MAIADLLIHIVILGVLIFFSAFFSATETALFSLGKITIKRLQMENKANAKLVAKLLDNPVKLLSSIVIGNMLVNILASSTASVLAVGLFGNKGLILSIGVMTFLILAFGEITPKSIAINNPEKVSLRVVPYINMFSKIVFPIRRILRFVIDFFIAQFSKNIRLKKDETVLTEEELRKAIHLGHKDGAFSVEEEKMFGKVFEFGDKKAKDIMRPRKEIIAFDVSTPLDEISLVIKEKELSRVPIYSKELNNILGILYAKDLIIASRKGPVDIKELLREPFYVPKDIRLDSLLRNFRTQRIRMVLVEDNGRLEGLITLEDLLEEIVGEIRDIRG